MVGRAHGPPAGAGTPTTSRSIVVTADHGAAFETGEPLRGVSEANADSVLWVPLLVKPPGQDTGRIDDRPATAVDVLPTIADVIDLELPGGDRRPLPARARRHRRRVRRAPGLRLGLQPADAQRRRLLADRRRAGLRRPAGPAAVRARATTPTCASTASGATPTSSGRRVADLPSAPDAGLSYSSTPTAAYRSSAVAQQDAYVAGSVDTDGRAWTWPSRSTACVGGWAELQRAAGATASGRVVPPALLRDDGDDEIELYGIDRAGPWPDVPTRAPTGTGPPS